MLHWFRLHRSEGGVPLRIRACWIISCETCVEPSNLYRNQQLPKNYQRITLKRFTGFVAMATEGGFRLRHRVGILHFPQSRHYTKIFVTLWHQSHNHHNLMHDMHQSQNYHSIMHDMHVFKTKSRCPKVFQLEAGMMLAEPAWLMYEIEKELRAV